MGLKSALLTYIKRTTSQRNNIFPILLCQLLLVSLALVSVKGCFPYHRGKVETSVVKLEHIDKVRLYSPYSATGNLGGGAAENYRQSQSPNVSVIVNFILPSSSNSDQKSESSDSKTKKNSTIIIDKRTQQRLAETVNNVLYGVKPKRS